MELWHWASGLASTALAEGGLSTGAALWLVAVVVLAGVVRGFTGFGTALVLLPLAAIVIRPVAALVLLTLLEIAGPLILLRRAWEQAERAVVGRLALGMLIGLVPGVLLMLKLPVEVFRWAVALVALAAVVLLGAGWRWTGPRGPRVQTGVGVSSGFLGGLTGLSGPPVVMFFLASPIPPHVVRANMILYLLALDLALLSALALKDTISSGLLVAAALLLPAFLAANAVGAWVFRAAPGSAAAYRPAALVLMAGAAIAGLPLWS